MPILQMREMWLVDVYNFPRSNKYLAVKVYLWFSGY